MSRKTSDVEEIIFRNNNKLQLQSRIYIAPAKHSHFACKLGHNSTIRCVTNPSTRVAKIIKRQRRLIALADGHSNTSAPSLEEPHRDIACRPRRRDFILTDSRLTEIIVPTHRSLLSPIEDTLLRMTCNSRNTGLRGAYMGRQCHGPMCPHSTPRSCFSSSFVPYLPNGRSNSILA